MRTGVLVARPGLDQQRRRERAAHLTALLRCTAGKHGQRTGEGDMRFDGRELVESVAEHELGIRKVPRKKKGSYTPREADQEVAAIAAWLKRFARPLQRGERHITYRQLRRILNGHDLTMANPKGNSIGIYRDVSVRKLLKTQTVQKQIATVPYPGDGKVVGAKATKHVRRLCHLDEAHGCDTEASYEGTDVIDVFVNEYRGILKRLARE